MSDSFSDFDTAPAKAGIDPLDRAAPDSLPENGPPVPGGPTQASERTRTMRAGNAVRSRSRIAQAGEQLLDLARRSPALSEKPALRLRKNREAPRPPALGLDARLSESEREQLVEVVDNQDRPLLCMPPENALRQKLPVRVVAVALRTWQNKLVLRKWRDAGAGGTGGWDLYTGFVRVGEAREDAALRLLSEAGLNGLSVSPVSGPEEREENSRFFTLFTADLPTGLYPSHPVQEIMTVDADELEGLIRDVPEMLSPEVFRAARAPGLLRV